MQFPPLLPPKARPFLAPKISSFVSRMEESARIAAEEQPGVSKTEDIIGFPQACDAHTAGQSRRRLRLSGTSGSRMASTGGAYT